MIQQCWTICWWIGLCLWLLAGGGGCVNSDLCRSSPCSSSREAEHQPSRQQCQGPRCSGRASRPSRAFVPVATPVRDQLQIKQLLSPQQQQQPLAGISLQHTAMTTRGTEESCSGGGDCTTSTPNGTRRDCKGIECRLPLRIRQKPWPVIQTIPCPPNQGEGCPEPTLFRVTERAAQFIGEDLAYTASDLGGAALGVQLTCDVKPGKWGV